MSSPYHLAVRGQIVIIGKEPDGDSARFIPNNPALLESLHGGHRVRPTPADGSVQLRFEGIDAPELHYGNAAQPLGEDARNRLLRLIGFRNVAYRAGSTLVEGGTPASVPALILSKGADVHGRPVSFVLLQADASNVRDGTWVQLTQRVLRATLNARMLQSGLAYYTVYTSTPLRETLRAIAVRAKAARRGVWPLDSTSEFQLSDQASIGPDGALILPKLFRRCTDYLKAVASGSFAGNLADWIVAVSTSPSRNENDRVVLPGGVEVHLSDLIGQRNRTVVFQPDPLDIVFVEK